MSNIYSWEVSSLDCVPSLDGLNNVISAVHWRINAVSTQGITTEVNGQSITTPYTATIYGVQQLTLGDKSQFIPYDSVTKDLVISWVKDAIGIDQVTALYAALDKQINNLITPPIVSPTLPWNM